MAASETLLIQDAIKGVSAGTNPASKMHCVFREIVLDVGVDLSNIAPVRLTLQPAKTVNTIITKGCGETCPYVPVLRLLIGKSPTLKTCPSMKPIDEAREIRDEIETKIKAFIAENTYRGKSCL
ncbi:hypothetical protein BGX30_010409 [Mortierella sp. GBA39]|nr:hypothetical protein BGX30_010409 [Mortierella sp. GBA39]